MLKKIKKDKRLYIFNAEPGRLGRVKTTESLQIWLSLWDNGWTMQNPIGMVTIGIIYLLNLFFPRFF
jgi:hypothetical protein